MKKQPKLEIERPFAKILPEIRSLIEVSRHHAAVTAYIQLSSKKPDGAVEMAEGVILHTTTKNEIVAIEILSATKKIPIKTLYKLELTPAAV